MNLRAGIGRRDENQNARKPQGMEQSPEVIAVMRQMLADNARAAENVVATARAEREKVIGERAAARQALLDTQQKSEQIAADFYREHHDRIEKDIREMLTRDFADRLLRAGATVNQVVELLDAPEGMVAKIAMDVAYVPIKPPDSKEMIYVRASFKDEGRGGYLTLQWGETTCRFWYEIAAAPALTVLEIPRDEQWEAQTGIPLSHRLQAHIFLAEQMLARHSSSSHYKFEDGSIVIY